MAREVFLGALVSWWSANGNATLFRELKGVERYEKIELADYARLDSAGAKLNNDWKFLQHLMALGQGAAGDWLGRKPPSAAPR